MKVYYYVDAEVGIPFPGPDADFLLPNGQKKYDVPWPRFIWYELPGFDKTDNPAEADLFCLRQRLIWLSDEQVRNLPHLKGNEHRHLFFDLGPDSDPRAFRTFPDVPAIFISATCDAKMMPYVIPWPWPVDDLLAHTKLDGFQYDVVFQGQTVQGGEKVLLDSIQNAGLNVHVRRNPSFYGTMLWGAPEKAQLHHEFLATLSAARLSLCHRSNSRGVVRYRFYEAMSMGRVPVLFCDDCVLPFSNRIDYACCSVLLKESDVPHAGEVLKAWLAKHKDEEIVEMGKYGRLMWERWLKRERWGEIVEAVVRERL